MLPGGGDAQVRMGIDGTIIVLTVIEQLYTKHVTFIEKSLH